MQSGIKKRDTAIIYMPMIPQAAFAMLACARIGYTFSCFGGLLHMNLLLE
jgi:propionyl-CoA synthetase